jgi:hypothetical protein
MYSPTALKNSERATREYKLSRSFLPSCECVLGQDANHIQHRLNVPIHDTYVPLVPERTRTQTGFAGSRVAHKAHQRVVVEDFPFFVSMLVSEVQPSLLKTVIDAVEFLDDHSLMRFVCDPRASKSSLSSCTFWNQGYKGVVDRDVETVLYVVRILAKNALTAWEKRTR